MEHRSNLTSIRDQYNVIQCFSQMIQSISDISCAIASTDEIIIKFPLPSHFSILSAELYVIKLAAIYDKNSLGKNSKQSVIITDAHAEITISNYTIKNQHLIVKEVIDILY